jgi:hypothetical protein
MKQKNLWIIAIKQLKITRKNSKNSFYSGHRHYTRCAEAEFLCQLGNLNL